MYPLLSSPWSRTAWLTRSRTPTTPLFSRPQSNPPRDRHPRSPRAMVDLYLKERERERRDIYSLYICSADRSTHTESNKLYRKVKRRYRPNISPRQRPTAKARHDQAALAVSAEARGATHRARPRSPYRVVYTQPLPHRPPFPTSASLTSSD